jgi:hypothetical protein
MSELNRPTHPNSIIIKKYFAYLSSINVKDVDMVAKLLVHKLLILINDYDDYENYAFKCLCCDTDLYLRDINNHYNDKNNRFDICNDCFKCQNPICETRNIKNTKLTFGAGCFLYCCNCCEGTPNSLYFDNVQSRVKTIESVILEEPEEQESEPEEPEEEPEPELEPIELYDSDSDDDYNEEAEWETECAYNAANILQSAKLFKSKCVEDCPICYEKEKCYAFFNGCNHRCCFDCMLQMNDKKCYYNCNTH